jgi:hypothetical protein
MVYTVAQFFQKFILSRVITKFLSRPRTSQKIITPFGLFEYSRDEVVAVSCLKACTAADATPGSPCHCGRPPGSRPGGLATTKWVLFSDMLVSSPSSYPAPPRNGPGTIFLPGKEVFARPGPAAPSQVPQTRYPSFQWAPPQRLDL